MLSITYFSLSVLKTFLGCFMYSIARLVTSLYKHFKLVYFHKFVFLVYLFMFLHDIFRKPELGVAEVFTLLDTIRCLMTLPLSSLDFLL